MIVTERDFPTLLRLSKVRMIVEVLGTIIWCEGGLIYLNTN